MTLELITATIVVVAQEHNPSILHPSFLESNAVVPKGLELEESPVSTPAFSRVVYQNGLVLQAETDRVQFAARTPPLDLKTELLPNVATAYVRTLPFVPYKAVGINFTGILPMDDPRAGIAGRFLREGPWNQEGLVSDSVGLKFGFEVKPGVLRLGLDVGEVQRPGCSESIPGVVVQSNYHCDLDSAENSLQGAVDLIGLYMSRIEDFESKVAMLFGEKV